jgi:hypothetical protein
VNQCLNLRFSSFFLNQWSQEINPQRQGLDHLLELLVNSLLLLVISRNVNDVPDYGWLLYLYSCWLLLFELLTSSWLDDRELLSERLNLVCQLLKSRILSHLRHNYLILGSKRPHWRKQTIDMLRGRWITDYSSRIDLRERPLLGPNVRFNGLILVTNRVRRNSMLVWYWCLGHLNHFILVLLDEVCLLTVTPIQADEYFLNLFTSPLACDVWHSGHCRESWLGECIW